MTGGWGGEQWSGCGGFRRGPGEGGESQERHKTIYFQMEMDFIFQPQCFFFITVKSYEVDVNRSLYALLCYLVLIKSGIVQAVPWPRKPSLHS